MRKLMAGIILALVLIGIVGVVYEHHSGSGSNVPPDYKGILVAKLGSMKCYSYSQNLTTRAGNSTETSTVEGVYSDGTYFFHGRRSDLEWWGILRNNTLVEKIEVNGSSKIVRLNLTDGEVKDFTMYDPVKLAFRALASSSSSTSSSSQVLANYTFYTEYKGAGALQFGTVRVLFDRNYSPVRIEVESKIKSGEKLLLSFSFTSDIKNSCSVPGWAEELERS